MTTGRGSVDHQWPRAPLTSTVSRRTRWSAEDQAVTDHAVGAAASCHPGLARDGGNDGVRSRFAPTPQALGDGRWSASRASGWPSRRASSSSRAPGTAPLCHPVDSVARSARSWGATCDDCGTVWCHACPQALDGQVSFVSGSTVGRFEITCVMNFVLGSSTWPQWRRQIPGTARAPGAKRRKSEDIVDLPARQGDLRVSAWAPRPSCAFLPCSS